MIYLVEGDILLSKAQALVQGVRVNDPMDKGLALALHELYPAMHKDFHHWCHSHHPDIGSAWLWSGANSVRVINLLTQEGMGSHDHRAGKSSLSHVNHALKALVKIIQKEQLTSIALPRLATGMGGLDWADVLPLIEQHLGQLDVAVYVYAVYRSEQAANEPTV